MWVIFIYVINLNVFTVAGYVKELFTASGLDVNVGLVQTAYSNGNSTKYAVDKLVYAFCFHHCFVVFLI